ncbi:MAG: DUF1573 domain-containing protein [Sphingobacteriales bacterium JAD_PAG50586_3]|nr:MAG: DUF1573 domain-containing protein [Sphingobacteriales bacterium JAD_PAG50586_3]
MKSLIFTSLSVLFFTGAFAQSAVTSSNPNPNGAEFTFKKEIHDFGKIPQDVPVKTTFEFTNIGKEPLIISDVKPSCQCTAPEWPKEPIAPGKSAKITVGYNAKAAGPFSKTVTITSNAKTNPKVITIKGVVEPAAKPADGTPEKKETLPGVSKP